eukprot:CFRG8091T1
MTILDLGDSIAGLAAIPVLVVSVGPVSKDKFQKYFSVIKHFNQIRLSELNLMSSTHYRSSEGLVSFKYLDCAKPKEGSQYEDIVYNHRILGVVGLIDCKTTPDLTAAAAEFDSITKNISSSLGSRCFAFEPTEAHQDNAQGVVLIPDQDLDQIKFYISTMMNDFGSSLLDVLNSLLKKKLGERHVANPRVMKLPFERSTTSDDMKLLRKRAVSRTEKQIGDLYLLASLTKEAQLHYYECMEQSKSSQDWLWFGASLEGYAASLILKAKSIGSTENTKDVIDRMQEALVNYQRVRGAQNLFLAASFRLVHYCIAIKDKATAIEVLTGVVTCDTIPSEDVKAKLYQGLARVYADLGFHRKSAFYTRQLTILVSRGAQKSHWQVAHALLLRCMVPYRVTSLKAYMASTRVDNTRLALSSDSVSSFDEQGIEAQTGEGGWTSLQTKVLKDLVLTSKCLGNRTLTVDYIAYILQTMHTTLKTNEQEDMALLLDTLNTKVTSDCTRYNWTSIPVVSALIPSVGPVAGKPLFRPMAGRKNSFVKSPFLYSAFAKKKEVKRVCVWVCDEVAEVTVTVTNPFAFPLICKDICLEVCGLEFENYPQTITLPPKSEGTTITLLGKPLQAGTLTILGLRVYCFGVRCIHSLPTTIADIEVMPRFPQLIAKHGILDKIKVPMDLLEGEMLQAEIRLENVGKDAIDWVSITVLPIRSPPDTKSIVQVTTTVDPIKAEIQPQTRTWDANAPRRPKNEERERQHHLRAEKEQLEDSQFEVASQDFIDDRLPLPANECLIVPVIVHGHVGCRGCTIKISYGNVEFFPEFMREYELRFEVNVSRALMFSRFDVLRLDQADASSLAALNIHPANTAPVNVRDLCLLSFDIINNSRHSFGLLFKAGKSLAGPLKDGIPSTTEAGTDMGTETNSRTMSRSKPNCRPLRDWVFTPLAMTLEGYCVRRVMLPIARKMITFNISAQPKDVIPMLCGDLVTEWNLCTRQSTGRIWFKEPTVSPLSLTRLFRYGLEVALDCSAKSRLHVMADSSSTPPTVRVDKSEPLEITISVVNVTNEDLSDVKLRIVPYQDAMNGLKLYDVDPQMARVGLWDVFLGPMKAGETREHHLAAVFLSSGLYKLAYELTPFKKTHTEFDPMQVQALSTDEHSSWFADAVNIHVHGTTSPHITSIVKNE